MAVKKLEGVLEQDAADTLVRLTRQTGARQSLFEAIAPGYIRFDLPLTDVETMAARAVPLGFKMTLVGVTSGLRLDWVFGSGGPNAFVLDGVLEWYPPSNFPLMFDEEITLELSSFGVGNTIECNYVMYYAIVQSTELLMVQAIEEY